MSSTVYGICAAVAGTILVIQLGLSFLGFDHDLDGADADLDAHAGDDGGHHGAFFGVLSFRTVTAALAFFGLAGLGGEASGWPSLQTFVVALIAGAGALYGTYWLGTALSSLQADATARPADAVGCPGSVYLRIPAERAGMGKVQVSQQGRTIEYEAVTAGQELRPGQSVVVVALVGADVVEVEESSR